MDYIYLSPSANRLNKRSEPLQSLCWMLYAEIIYNYLSILRIILDKKCELVQFVINAALVVEASQIENFTRRVKLSLS